MKARVDEKNISITLL